MTLIEVRGPSGTLIGRCDARCYEAKGSQCTCICGGKNHGRGAAAALPLTRMQGLPLIAKGEGGLFTLPERKGGMMKKEKIYVGRRERVTDPYRGVGTGQHTGWVEHTALVVTVNGRPLDPRLDLANKSPTGFECGYAGSGPHQLALAILADLLGDDERALALMSYFAHEVIARLPRDREWELTEKEIRDWLSKRGE